MAKIRVVGMDPSLRNWGISTGTLDLQTNDLQIERVSVIQPAPEKGKQVRKNSTDLQAAKQLSEEVLAAIKGAQAIFVEVPVGSQSARAMASYGICVGILGAIRANGIPFFEVTPTEVKVTAVGSKVASKDTMINWAVHRHPEANWPKAASKAEHMADATAAIYAGLKTNEFQRIKGFLN